MSSKNTKNITFIIIFIAIIGFAFLYLTFYNDLNDVIYMDIPYILR
jgi:hypothetical protein